MDEFDVLLALAREVRDGDHYGWYVRSTTEKLAAALILNRADWLAEMRYTIPEALERIGTKWAQQVPPVAQALNADKERGGDAVSEPPRKPPPATRIRATRGGRA